jgi:glutamate formiminotransferase
VPAGGQDDCGQGGPGQEGSVGPPEDAVLECVINVSEGHAGAAVDALRHAAGAALLDVHLDADHNRAVFTLAAGDDAEVEAAARRLTSTAVELLDLSTQRGAHPRLGVVDVVPWVHLEPGPDGRLRDASIAVAAAARDRFAAWAAAALDLPAFVYGPVPSSGGGRTLPELRRRAWRDLPPDRGPAQPHPRAGATCVGARPALVAYNLWLRRPDLAEARRVAAEVRGPGLRTLGLAVGSEVQVSCNLVAPWVVGPDAAFDAVAGRAEVARAELVGLAPRAVVEAVPATRWSELDLDPSRTIEARLSGAGLDGGRFAARRRADAGGGEGARS